MSEVRERSHADDGDLLHRCARGDDIAWVDLLGRYEGLVFSVPLNYGLSRDEVLGVGLIPVAIAVVASRLWTSRHRQDVIEGGPTASRGHPTPHIT